MKRNKKRYHVYCGYYEVWISEKILRRPLSHFGWHRTIEAAYAHAERLQPEAICFDTSLRDEAIEKLFQHCYDPFFDRRPPFPVFNGKKYSIKRGLTALTREYFRVAGDCVPSAQDIWDITQWLHHLTGEGVRKLANLLRGKTFDEIAPFLSTAEAS